MTSFSIIICTYNPNFDLLKKLFSAIHSFERNEILVEVIIVDNNSNPLVRKHNSVQNFLTTDLAVQYLVQEEPGLTAARKAGIRAAKYDWLIFFDDDNEPAVDYLIKASQAINQYPQTVAWGAAEVEVEYIDPVANWLEDEKDLFQKRSNSQTSIANEPHWQLCYPYGTGLIIRKDIAILYEERVKQQRYTLTDRKGKSLVSGGDVQMVLTGVEQGYYAGVISGLRIKHLIDASKATLFYLQRQQYGTASAYIKAYNQVFIKDPVPLTTVTNKQVFKMAYSLYRIYYKKVSKHRFRLMVASKMGELNAMIEASSSKKPLLLRLYEKFIYV